MTYAEIMAELEDIDFAFNNLDEKRHELYDCIAEAEYFNDEYTARMLRIDLKVLEEKVKKMEERYGQLRAMLVPDPINHDDD